MNRIYPDAETLVLDRLDHETRQRLRAMAYVDGELSEPDRLQFEADARCDPALRSEVAEFKELFDWIENVRLTL